MTEPWTLYEVENLQNSLYDISQEVEDELKQPGGGPSRRSALVQILAHVEQARVLLENLPTILDQC